jgi:hypothetical protein
MQSEAKTYHIKGEQGDVRFRLVPRASMPADVREAVKVDGKYVAAHSETGHHHVVDPTEAVLYETSDPFVAYLVLDDGVSAATSVHLKTGEHVHGPVTLVNKGIDWVWQVSRQREWQPEGLRAAAD